MSDRLTIEVRLLAGADLHKVLVREMLPLARRLGVTIEAHANGATFWADPEDNEKDLSAAFTRLYPASSIVAQHITTPVPYPLGHWSNPEPEQVRDSGVPKYVMAGIIIALAALLALAVASVAFNVIGS